MYNMPSQLVNELLATMDTKIFQLVLQLIIVGAIIMYIKDLNGRVANYYKLKMSDFGRGTKVKIDGKEGTISAVRFSEVEITLDEEHIMLVPVAKFVDSIKIISMDHKRNCN